MGLWVLPTMFMMILNMNIEDETPEQRGPTASPLLSPQCQPSCPHSYLLSQATAIMPRSQKSKHRAREKRRETQGQPQGLTGPQATAENQKEPHSSTISSPDYRGARPKSSHASVPQKSQGAAPTDSLDAGASCSKSDVAAKGQNEKTASTSPSASVPQGSQGASPTDSLDAGVACSKSDVAAKGQDEKSAGTSPSSSVPQRSQGASLTDSLDAGASCSKSDVAAKVEDEKSAHASLRARYFKSLGKDPIDKKSWRLVQFVQEKFEKNESILKADMLKLVGRRYKERFPKIFNKTCRHLTVTFGVEMKEMDSSGESYTLVSKLGLSSEGSLSGVNALAKSGILMSALSFIFFNGNRAAEDKVWHFLGFLGISPRAPHPLYGNPEKILTEDLVQAKYLQYQQVHNSYPPRYEFLWGPRAHFETNKMRVLRAFTEMNNSVPGLYPNLYEEALIHEVQKALRVCLSQQPSYSHFCLLSLPIVMPLGLKREEESLSSFSPVLGSGPQIYLATDVLQESQRADFIITASFGSTVPTDGCKIKELITKPALLNVVNKKSKDHFSEILRGTSECMELLLPLN
ncbi:Melanoma-associated antigen B6 [Plecturocebus cupreus]